MKVLPFNLNTTKQTYTKGEKVEYIKPGAHLCTITSISTSDNLDNYNGSPFIDFNVSSNNKVGRCRFWAVKETDKPSTMEWKTKQIKDFLVNAGVKDFSDDSTAMNASIGKSLMVAFISEEYIGVNKDTDEPVIRESVRYRWSSKEGGNCTYTPDMNKQLTEEQISEFSMKHSQWSKNSNANYDTHDVDDDLPF